MRQEYLRGLIEKAPITHATFRLADLLLQGNVTKIVVTPNFDDLLLRALSLFGKQPAICDDPRTVERIDPEKSEIQLIYLHGSYSFYDCRNTNTEVMERSLSRADTTLTMAALLDKVLSSRSPLVIGYSGWENDVFMTALRRRLLTSLPFNLYWFCYRREEITQLPEFLNHPDVYFVCPAGEGTEIIQEALAEDDASQNKPAEETGKKQPSLSATAILDLLLNQTGKESPFLTRHPLGFFAERLRSELPRDDADNGQDIYSFRSVLERVERAVKWDEDTIRRQEENDALLEKVREAVRRAQYEEALTIARQLTNLTSVQLRELINTMDAAAAAMGDKSSLTPAACDIAISSYAELEKMGQPQPPKTLVDAAVKKGNAFYAIGQYAAAVSAYDQAIAPLSDDPEAQVALAAPRNNKGLALKSLRRTEEALLEHETVISRLATHTSDAALNSVVVALVFKGTIHAQASVGDAALAAFDAAQETASKIKVQGEYTKTMLADAGPSVVLARALVAAAKAPGA